MASLPNAPNITIRPDARDQTLKFFWSPPTDNGSPAVTSYELTDGGANTVSLSPETLFYTYSGLTNGTSYTFRIAASNTNGLGPYAFFRTVQPGLTPAAPVLSTVINTSGTQTYAVGWSNPSNLGGATNLLGTLLTAIPVDSNGDLVTTSSLYIKTSVIGGDSNAFQQAIVPLTSNYNYKVLIQPVVDAGYSRIPVYTSTISSSYIPPPTFTPSTIGGMQLWLDAADTTSLTLSGSAVTLWNDKSGNNKNFSNASGSARPIYDTTTSSLYFSSFFLDSGSIISTGQRNLHFLGVWSISTTTGATFQSVFEQNALANSNGYRFMVYGSPFDSRTGNFYGINGYGTSPTPTGAFPTFNVNSTMVSYVGAQSDGTTFSINNRHNGALYSTQTITQVNMNVSSATTRLGRIVGGTTEPFYGKLSEILFYSSILSANQYFTLEGYLAWKWGLSTLLPSTHPFYTRAPLITDSNIEFSPSSITNMSLWFDANDATTMTFNSSNQVQTWNDKSGSSNNATLFGGTAIRSTLLGNAVALNCSNLRMTLNNSTFLLNNSNDSATFFFVFRTLANFINNHPLSYAVNSGINGHLNFNDNNLYEPLGYDVRQNLGTIFNATTPHIYSLVAGRNVGTKQTIVYRTGSQQNSQAYGSNYTASNLRIGGATVDGWNNLLGEICVFNKALTVTEQQQIEGYLAWKWGLQQSLPTTHLYASRAPTRLDTFSTVGTSTILGPISSS